MLLIVATLLFTAQAAYTTQLLKGRIEQIFGQSDPRMPSVNELDARTEKIDQRLIDKKLAPNRVPPGLKTFPALLRGEWTGDLKVTQIECTEAYWKALPVEAQLEEQFFQIGKLGHSKFRFFADRNAISMSPPVVQFAVNSQEAVLFSKKGVKILFMEADEASGRPWRSNSGECHFTAQLVKNEVTQLAPAIVEQDTLVHALLVNEKTQLQTKYYSEHVFRFEKRGSFEMRVQVAEVCYGPDGKLWKRMLLEGDLK